MCLKKYFIKNLLFPILITILNSISRILLFWCEAVEDAPEGGKNLLLGAEALLPRASPGGDEALAVYTLRVNAISLLLWCSARLNR